MATWDTVRELALSFPGVEESTGDGSAHVRVRGKVFAWREPRRETAAGSPSASIREEKQLLLDANPEAVLHETRTTTGSRLIQIAWSRSAASELRERDSRTPWLIRSARSGSSAAYMAATAD